MAEKVVSVKMPASLVKELRRLQKRDHYLDLSEQLRSIVRQRCLELTNPYTAEIKRLRQDIQQEIDGSSTAREQILNELIDMLRGGNK